ncbi:MAG: hypothetical protein HY521_10710 [Proteobacteria bacterium]|nr:hypothetical protein [Pseudomonadota bacterium]
MQQALRALVIVMGLALVAGFGGLAVGLYQKATRGGAPVESPGAAAPAEFGTVRLGEGPEARVVETVAAEGRLFIRLSDSDWREWIVVLDLGSGRVLGRIEVQAER